MTLANLFPDVWAFIRLVLTALATTGLATWAFKILGEKWLSAKFSERLEAYKHAQQKELERLKFNINSLMDRTTKLHQYEFDVLPELWGLLNDAFGHAIRLVSRLQTNPDLDRMEPEHLAEFIEACDLPQWQNKKLAVMTHKNDEYFKMIFWLKLNKANGATVEFNNFYVKNGIFIQSDLKTHFDEIRDMIFEALNEKEFEKSYGVPREGRYEKSDRLWQNGEAKLAEIGALVQNRLWNAQSLDD